ARARPAHLAQTRRPNATPIRERGDGGQARALPARLAREPARRLPHLHRPLDPGRLAEVVLCRARRRPVRRPPPLSTPARDRDLPPRLTYAGRRGPGACSATG